MFHQGIAEALGLSIGVVVVLVGLVVLLAWIPLHQHLGLGTVLNTLSIGLIANLGLSLIPEQHLLVVRDPAARGRAARLRAGRRSLHRVAGSGPARATA